MKKFLIAFVIFLSPLAVGAQSIELDRDFVGTTNEEIPAYVAVDLEPEGGDYYWGFAQPDGQIADTSNSDNGNVDLNATFRSNGYQFGIYKFFLFDNSIASGTCNPSNDFESSCVNSGAVIYVENVSLFNLVGLNSGSAVGLLRDTANEFGLVLLIILGAVIGIAIGVLVFKVGYGYIRNMPGDWGYNPSRKSYRFGRGKSIQPGAHGRII